MQFNNNSDVSRINREVTDVMEIIEILRERLYFMVVKVADPYIHQSPASMYHYFTTDKDLVYQNFNHDFGPLNLGRLYTFCQLLHYKLNGSDFEKKKIVYYTAFKESKRCNAAFLIAAYSVAFLDRSPNEALEPLMTSSYSYRPFRDANASAKSLNVTLKDCMCALNKSFYFNFVDLSDFDVTEYLQYEGGNFQEATDLSWIIPDKLVAFAGPCHDQHLNCPVEQYVGYFHRKSVTTVVRLNDSHYDPRRFTRHGIEHFEMYFPDGSTPDLNILRDFLTIVESNRGAVAVHCKAGLGRTGCLIGAFLIKHYGMSAHEAIAWMRICRPGCIIGHQQTWLEKLEGRLLEEGYYFRAQHNGKGDYVRVHRRGMYSIQQGMEGLKKYGQPDHTMGVTSSYDITTLKIRNNIKGKYTRKERDSIETQGDFLMKAKAAALSRANKVKL